MINININKNSNQSGRKERLECSEDTKLFFDDVYKSGTRGKKQQVDVLQYGRSMIEMLGVLAIVGVLSVGGISGYSKAMDMFKANKMKEQVNQIFYNAIKWISLYNSASGQNKKIDVCTNIMEVAREYHSDITSVQNREYNDPNDAWYYDRTLLNLKTATPITINQFCTACAQDANCSIYVFFRS